MLGTEGHPEWKEQRVTLPLQVNDSNANKRNRVTRPLHLVWDVGLLQQFHGVDAECLGHGTLHPAGKRLGVFYLKPKTNVPVRAAKSVFRMSLYVQQ